MSSVTLIFPHQLFKDHPALQQGRQVYLVEEWLFFRQYNFHKHKLILHRSGMKEYEAHLIKRNYIVKYIDTTDARNDVRKLISALQLQQVTELHIADVADNWLKNRITTVATKYNIKIVWYASPGFLNTMDGVAGYFNKRATYFQTDFYIHQRKQRSLLLQNDGQPKGGKWTFDADNRLRFPKSETPPVVRFTAITATMAAATEYVQQHFPDNYGQAGGPYLFASGYKASEAWLQDFLVNRFEKFGIYEDAIVAGEHILHHSVLTPMLNTGLLQPQQILNAVTDYAGKQAIPLNSLEGFVRQVVGWREFMRIVYEREGSRQRTANYWDFHKKIPESFWKGTTGITPVDITIKKVLQTGYCHHIERLMVLGNFMLLCEFDPNEVYRWFMELFIDAYDWVMVPNVYGMTQFADGGLMTTKPYISGSNYLMKMSNYEKGSWQQVWDGLFWRFMHVHRDFFLQNARLGMLVGTFDKMSSEKRNAHLQHAEAYLGTL